MGKSNRTASIKRQSQILTPKRIYGKRADYAERVLSEELKKRYIEYRKKWLKVSQRKLVSVFPLYIQIEHVGKCNLRCPICVQGIRALRQNYSRGFSPLDMELYKKILNEVKRYGCPSISFHNNDEPLLLNDLEARIELAKEAGFLDIILTTNATLLNRQRAHKLLRSGITKINFSVDAYDENGYRQRRGGDFKRVLKNIDYFIKQKKISGLKLPVTRVTCVLTKFSVKDMHKFRQFWAKKVDMVEFQNFQAIKGYTEEFIPSQARVDSSFTCNAPWQQLVIRANGDVLPCCSFYGTEMIIGNVRKSSIYDIWNSARMGQIRKQLLNNNFSFSAACKKCSETFYIS